MAQITWRNIDAPDFSTSLRGIGLFSDLLGGAFNSARSGLNSFQAGRDQRVNRGVQLALAQAQDPEALAELTGSLPTDLARNLDADTVGMIAARPGQLVNQALARENLDFTKYSNDRTRTRNSARDTASPIMQEILARNAAGDIEGARKLATENAGTLGALQYEDRASLVRDSQAAAQGDLSYDSGVFNFGRQRIGAQRSDAEYARNEAADTLVARYQDYDNLADVERDLNGLKLDPRVKALARAKLGIAGPKDYGDLDMTGGIGGGGNFSFAAPQQSVANTLKSGGLSDSVVAGFLGNFHIEGGYGGGQGDGGSAGGIAQWRNERRQNFQRVIGVDPVKASPEQQARFVLWELNNPKAAGMTDAQATAIKNARNPEEAAKLIDAHFERSDGRSTLGRVNAANQALEYLTGVQRNLDRTASQTDLASQNPIVDAFRVGAQNPNQNSRQVALEIAGADKSYNPVWLETEISKMVNEANKSGGGRRITPRMAGEIIKQYTSSQGSSEFFGRLIPDAIANNTVGSDLIYDKDAVRNELKKYRTGGLDDAISSQAQQGIASQQEAGALAARNAALASFQRKQAAAMRGRQVNLAPEIMALQAAEANLSSVRGAIDDPRSGLRTPAQANTSPAPAPRSQAKIPPPRQAPPRNAAQNKRIQDAWNSALIKHNTQVPSVEPGQYVRPWKP